MHFNVTAHPTPEWTVQQMREALPFDQIPRYLLRDRDGIFGGEFQQDVKAMGITEVLSAPRSPWQRAYVERVIGTIRREYLDHVVVFGEASLHQHMKLFLNTLAKDAPEPRPVQPPEHGSVVAMSMAAEKRSILAGKKGPAPRLRSGLDRTGKIVAGAVGYFSAGSPSEPFVLGAR